MRQTIRLILGAVLVLATLGAAPALAAKPFPSRIDLPDGFQPEGITSGRGLTVYVGSLANGAIWKGNTRTGRGSVLFAGAAGLVSVGIDYERRANRLWVAGGPTSTVRVHDASSGALLQTYSFTSGFLNDVVVTKDAVYVTDSNVQQLIVIPLGPGGALPDPSDAFTLPLTGDIAYVPNAFNANGIVAARGWLLIVQSETGQLFRVDPDTGRARLVDLRGYSLTAGDGLERRGSTLYVVRNQLNLVAELKLRARLLSARLVDEHTSPSFSVPTTATRSAGDLYAVNSRFGTPPTPDTEYWITRVPGT